MSHTLTELDEFTATVVVPDGIDSRNDAAGDVERIAQALANRTNALNLHVARKDVANVWTQGQRFELANDATPMLQAISPPMGSDVWKIQHEYKISDTIWVRFYSGNAVGSGVWCITANARWDPDGQQWWKDDPARESNTLQCHNQDLRWYGKAPGGATWAHDAWDSTRGIFRAGDTVNAKNIQANDLYKYTTPPTRLMQLFPDGGWSVGVRLTPNTPGAGAYWRVNAPAGAKLGVVRIKVSENPNANYGINLLRLHSINMSDNANPPTQLRDQHRVTSAGNGIIMVTLDFAKLGELVVNNEDEVYWLYTWVQSESPTYVDIYAMQLSFIDPGPRNH